MTTPQESLGELASLLDQAAIRKQLIGLPAKSRFDITMLAVYAILANPSLFEPETVTAAEHLCELRGSLPTTPSAPSTKAAIYREAVQTATDQAIARRDARKEQL